MIGGILQEKTIKYTKKGQTMAFITLEDLVGSVEVLVFPKLYEQYSELLNADEKLFIEGRVSVEDDEPSKLLAEKIWRFEDVPYELWFQFPDEAAYAGRADELNSLLIEGQKPNAGGSDHPERFLSGSGENAPQSHDAPVALSRIAVYAKEQKSVRNLRFTARMYITRSLLQKLKAQYGNSNVMLLPGRLDRGRQRGY